MDKRQIAKFIELDLGLADGDDKPGVVIRMSAGATDVLHEGHTFKSDARLKSIGDITETIWLEKTSTLITLTAVDVNLTRRINTGRYRNRQTRIFMANIEADGTLSDVIVFRLYGNAHKYQAELIRLELDSVWARFEQSAPNRNSTSAQAALIAGGAFEGVAPSAVDRAFESATIDYSDIALGAIAPTTRRESLGRNYPFGPRKFLFVNIPGNPGTSLSDTAADYARSVIYGGATVAGDLIAAWNPSHAAVTAAWPGEWVDPPPNVVADTRYVQMIFAVCSGQLASLTVNLRGILNEATLTGGLNRRIYGERSDYSRTFSPSSRTRTITTGGKIVAAIEVTLGADNQAALPRAVTIGAGGRWTAEHRAYGTALVAVTVAAHDVWAGSLPDIDFSTSGRIVDTLDADGNRIAGVTGSDNPAWCLLDLITNTRFGRGLTDPEINLASFAAGADLYRRTFPSGDYEVKCRGDIGGNITYHAAITAILEATHSHLITDRAGRIELLVKGYPTAAELETAAALVFHRGDRAPIKSVRYAQSAEVYNHVRVETPIINRAPGEIYELTVRDDAAFEADQYQKSESSLNLSMVGAVVDDDGNADSETVETLTELARAAIDRSRLFITATFSTFMWEYKSRVKAGSLVTLADPIALPGLPRLGRITEVTFSGYGVMTLKWVEFSPDIYDPTRSVQAFLTVAVDPTGGIGGTHEGTLASESKLITVASSDNYTAVTYTAAFTSPPALTINLIDAAAGTYMENQNQTATGFEVRLRNIQGDAIGGDIDYFAIGFI